VIEKKRTRTRKRTSNDGRITDSGGSLKLYKNKNLLIVVIFVMSCI